MDDREANGKEDGEERLTRSPEDSNGDDYTKARRLWAEFRAGLITASQLSGALGRFGKDNKSKEIGDLYGKNGK